MTSRKLFGTAELIVLRTFSVLAAGGLVAAVALGSALPPDEPLGQVIAGWNDSALPALQRFELRRLGGWAWSSLTLPVLVRPSWLIPLALGIICLGAVTTLTWRQADTSNRRG